MNNSLQNCSYKTAYDFIIFNTIYLCYICLFQMVVL